MTDAVMPGGQLVDIMLREEWDRIDIKVYFVLFSFLRTGGGPPGVLFYKRFFIFFLSFFFVVFSSFFKVYF